MIAITEDGKITKEVLRPGSGPHPQSGQKVQVHYVAKILTSPHPFDSSRDTWAPYTFKVGEGGTTPWSLGIVTMSVGELSRFVVAADYAYGAEGMRDIVPPNASLEIEAELLDIQELFDSQDGAIARANELNEAAGASF
jgi:peptidylprolyl isomerase